jgi:NADP-reducing hydrogenase subunit HndB
MKSENWIKVGLSTCGIAAGADEVFSVLVDEAKKRNLDIAIKRTGCTGMCYAEPLVEVKVEGMPAVTYGKVTRDLALKILEEHVCAKHPVKDAIYDHRIQ